VVEAVAVVGDVKIEVTVTVEASITVEVSVTVEVTITVVKVPVTVEVTVTVEVADKASSCFCFTMIAPKVSNLSSTFSKIFIHRCNIKLYCS